MAKSRRRSTKKCSSRKFGVKAHDRKGSKRVKSHCRKYSKSKKSKRSKRRSSRKGSCKKGSRRISFMAKGNRVSFCSKKKRSARRSKRSRRSARKVKLSPSRCRGLSEDMCNSDPSCRYTFNKGLGKSYCAGRPGTRRGKMYEGPMGMPAGYSFSSSAPEKSESSPIFPLGLFKKEESKPLGSEYKKEEKEYVRPGYDECLTAYGLSRDYKKPDDVNKAYRKLALKWHPDRLQPGEDATYFPNVVLPCKEELLR